MKADLFRQLPYSVQATLRSSSTVFVIGDGQSIDSRGKLPVDISLGSESQHFPLEIIDSSAEWDILLGRDFLGKFQAILQIQQDGITKVWIPTPEIQKILDATPRITTAGFKFGGSEGKIGGNLDSTFQTILCPMLKDTQWDLQDDSDIPTLPPEEPFRRSDPRTEDGPLLTLLQAKIDSCPTMTSEERARVEAIFKKYTKAFALSIEDLGEGFSGQDFKIELKPGESGPRCSPYSTSQTDDVFLKGVLDDLLKHGLISRSNSRYSSPALIARTTAREPRFCIAYNRLNSMIEWDSYPLPTIDEVIQTVAPFKYFIKFDLKKGYWQIRITDPRTKELMAFTCKHGKFEWNRLPFGISTGPGFFQKIADMICNAIDPVHLKAYLDDIVLAANTIAELIALLEKTLKYFQDNGLKLHPEKCEFFQTEIDLLGHHISAKGITPLSKILDRLRLKERPKTPNEVRAFLGLAGYYQKFIRNYSQRAFPLTELTKKTVKFIWDEECERSFLDLRETLKSDQVLSKPDFTKRFFVITDASLKGVGAVLSQENEDGELSPIMFASKKLSESQRNYSASQRECLGLIWSLKRFHYYVYGREFTVYTDLTALQWLDEVKTMKGIFARWSAALLEYQFVALHRPGVEIPHADGLSRFSLFFVHSYKDMMEYVRDGTVPENLSFKEAAELARASESYSFYGNQLHKIHRQEERIVPPPSLRTEIVKQIHERVHSKFGKVMAELRVKYYWPKMNEDVEKVLRECKGCRQGKAKVPNLSPYRYPELPWKPFTWIIMDLLGPLVKTEQGNRFILVIQDYTTKYALLFAIPNKEAATIGSILYLEIFMKFGCPRKVSSDNGTEFNNDLLQALYLSLDISQTLSSRYHPMSQGSVERLNGTITTYISRLLPNPESENRWDQILRRIEFGLNVSIHGTMMVSPFQLLYGFTPDTMIDTVLNPTVVMEWTEDEVEDVFRRNLKYRKSLIEMIQHSIAQQRLRVSESRTPHADDVYREGMLVMRRNPTPAKTGIDFWNGPYFVEQVLESGGVRIRVDHQTILVNQRDIKPVHVPEYPPPDILARAYDDLDEEEVKESEPELQRPLQSPPEDRSIIEMQERGVACYDSNSLINERPVRLSKDVAVARMSAHLDA